MCAVDEQVGPKQFQTTGVYGRDESRQDMRPVRNWEAVFDTREHGECDACVQDLVVSNEADPKAKLVASVEGPAEYTVAPEVYPPGLFVGQYRRTLVMCDRAHDPQSLQVHGASVAAHGTGLNHFDFVVLVLLHGGVFPAADSWLHVRQIHDGSGVVETADLAL